MAAGAPAQMMGDHQRLKQILFKLLDERRELRPGRFGCEAALCGRMTTGRSVSQ
jgi:hypothetical protein